MISIKHRFTRAILCEFDVETIKHAAENGRADLCGANLCEANLCEADLCGANLRGADLCGANLRGADLCGADLRGADLCGADLREANLRGANLREANLRGADLCGANLCEADLREADLRGAVIECEKITKTPIQIPIGLTYVALITNGFMRLGCKRYSHAEWAEFSDDQISEMDSEALEFWKVWKAPLLAMCAAHAGESK